MQVCPLPSEAEDSNGPGRVLYSVIQGWFPKEGGIIKGKLPGGGGMKGQKAASNCLSGAPGEKLQEEEEGPETSLPSWPERANKGPTDEQQWPEDTGITPWPQMRC